MSAADHFQIDFFKFLDEIGQSVLRTDFQEADQESHECSMFGVRAGQALGICRSSSGSPPRIVQGRESLPLMSFAYVLCRGESISEQ